MVAGMPGVGNLGLSWCETFSRWRRCYDRSFHDGTGLPHIFLKGCVFRVASEACPSCWPGFAFYWTKPSQCYGVGVCVGVLGVELGAQAPPTPPPSPPPTTTTTTTTTMPAWLFPGFRG